MRYIKTHGILKKMTLQEEKALVKNSLVEVISKISGCYVGAKIASKLVEIINKVDEDYVDEDYKEFE